MQKMPFMQRNNRIQQQNANYVDITIAIVVYQAFTFQHQLIEIILQLKTYWKTILKQYNTYKSVDSYYPLKFNITINNIIQK